ncbi:PAS domain S-box protein [bacterium]|nr:PAS domain S-box protein [bacterium]
MKLRSKTVLLAFLLGLLIWIIDGTVDYLAFYEGSWWEVVFLEARGSELFDRLFDVFLVVGIGLYFGRFLESYFASKEEALQSQTRYNNLHNNMLDAMILTDQDRNLRQGNGAFTQLFGYEPDEYVGQNIRILYNNEAQYQEIGKRISRAEGPTELLETIIFRKKDRSTFPGEVSIFSEHDEQGLLVSSVGVIRDISERVEFEHKISHLNSVLFAIRQIDQLITRVKDPNQLLDKSCEILENSRSYKSVWIVRVDADGNAIHVSGRSSEPNFKSRYEEILGTNLPSCANRAFSAKSMVNISANPDICQLCRLRKDKNSHCTTALRVQYEDMTHAIMVLAGPEKYIHTEEETELIKELADDIAYAMHMIEVERRRAESEEQARVAQNRLQSLFGVMPVGVGMIDYERNIIEVNDYITREFGYTREELIGKNTHDLYINEDEYNRVRVEINEKIDRHGFGSLQTYWKHKNGNAVPILLASRWINPEDHSQGSTFSVLDISDRLADAEEREKLRVQVHQAQKMEAIGRLAGGVAHDFNNMLSVILGNVEIVLDTIPEGLDVEVELSEIQQAAERSAALTRQLLMFSRKQISSPRTINLNEIIYNQSQMLIRLIGENIKFEFQAEPELRNIFLDPAQADQIFANLSVNARDAINGTGEIRVRTRNVTLDEKVGGIQPVPLEGQFVEVMFSDNGSGMDRETAARIFEPFFTTKDLESGTGLGLATVYGIVSQAKGGVRVVSHPDRGTTFYLYFPMVEEEAVPLIKEPESIQRATPAAVLVVEDEEKVRNLACRLLEQCGHKVYSAALPSTALKIVEQHGSEIELVLTDVIMPEMNGRDLVMEIMKKFPLVRTLYMSAFEAETIAHEGVLDPGVPFLPKPFTINEFKTKVVEALNDEVQPLTS